jgi:hypothetical protein
MGGRRELGVHAAKQVLYCLSQTSSPFCSSYFGDEVSRIVCLGWPWTKIPSHLGVKAGLQNHQCLAAQSLKKKF